MKRSSIKISPMLLVFAALGGCSESTASPPTIAGLYTAIVFMTTGTSGQTNQLLAGSSLNIALNADGTTTGHLHRANPTFDADMAGSWTQEGDIVRFDQAADTFVRDMAFTVQRISASQYYLVGDDTFAGTRINLTLARQTNLAMASLMR